MSERMHNSHEALAESRIGLNRYEQESLSAQQVANRIRVELEGPAQSSVHRCQQILAAAEQQLARVRATDGVDDSEARRQVSQAEQKLGIARQALDLSRQIALELEAATSVWSSQRADLVRAGSELLAMGEQRFEAYVGGAEYSAPAPGPMAGPVLAPASTGRGALGRVAVAASGIVLPGRTNDETGAGR